MSVFSPFFLSWLLEVLYSLVCGVACYVVLYGADVFSGLFLDAAAFPQRKDSFHSVPDSLLSNRHFAVSSSGWGLVWSVLVLRD